MKEGIFNYFKNYFDCSARRWKIGLDLNFRVLNEERAMKLEEPFSMKEIKEAVWSYDESKVPGPDGFNLCFFRKCWEIVKHDLFKVMSDFFTFGKLEKSINSSFITLTPTVENPIEISEFRPIFLVSSLYKIVSKVFLRRLREMVGDVASDTQCAFIKGRWIFDGVLIANELIHSVLKKGGCGGKLIFKLDFSKAYDCVGWDFLELVLLKIGFGEKWRGWMLECLSTARAAVIINGSSSNEFRFRRGLRQGDPLSLFLFILVTEVLHLALDKAAELGLIGGFNNVIHGMSFSHLQFADDTILFLKVDDKEIFSGLCINFKKSCLVGFEVEEELLFRLATSCKCEIGSLPFNYLGIPLGANLKRLATWEPIIDRVRKIVVFVADILHVLVLSSGDCY
ncbi:LINE-1 reverse transcriptase isogeny [Gossypium australe]|uniref:LINE-1 reverse transcriptase isogeny n=1 Tax=Gossypium australe TaxID=47621 RepID=A0A5B6V2Z6_9ROSI|nr:LINE-1 reverse transcriptase isogeny [Gossypium australe]